MSVSFELAIVRNKAQGSMHLTAALTPFLLDEHCIHRMEVPATRFSISQVLGHLS
jgi:hypothetical protein